MRTKRIYGWSVGLLGLFLLVGCQPKYPGYQRTEEGLYVRFIETDSTRPKPAQGDFLKLAMDCFLRDSLLYSSSAKGESPRIQLKPSGFRGDILSGLALMREGDSASFLVQADSAWNAMFGAVPGTVSIRPKDRIRYEIRLEKIQTKEDFQLEVEALYESIRSQSEADFQAYLEQQQIDAKPTENGVYCWTTQAGNGRRPSSGDLVEVNYVGRFLDGTVFDSTYRDDSCFRFVLGNGYVIPGWEEVLPRMQVGSRITALIPFAMAYGDHSVGRIPPYSNLVYDIALQKITDSEEVERQYRERMETVKAQSKADFQAYLEAHHISETPTPSGLFILRKQPGNGRHAGAGMKARIRFEAQTLEGVRMGVSEEPYQEVVIGKGAVLAGVDEGLLSMSEGETVTLLIPYPLAYGAMGYGNIPPYTNILLDLQLVELLQGDENE